MKNTEETIRQKSSEERKNLQAEGLVPLWMTTDGWGLFKAKYSVKGEKAFKGRAETIAKTAAQYMPDKHLWEKKFFELIWNGWLSCSTPVLSNTGTNRGMSVSCSGQFIGDSVDDFYGNLHESAMLSKYGFGTSGYLGDIRPRGSSISIGGKASGAAVVFQDFVTMAQKVSQGSNRRGAWAGYLPISHLDFDELINNISKNPEDCNVGWNIYDSDLEALKNNDPEILRRLGKALKLKATQGKGYFFFPDKINRAAPQMYKDKDLKVKSSNLCSEIALFQDKDHTFTCVLSSMNIAKFNEWKDTDAIFTATVFLDCIAEDFIQKAKGLSGFEKAVRFTEKGRALGLGVCGFHTYLQQEGIPLESLQAMIFNEDLFSKIQKDSLEASKYLAVLLGEPEWCKGYGVRNTHRTCCPPTMSTSMIMGGVSQGIEPMIGNAFVASLAGGEAERVNPVFLELLKKKGLYTDELIRKIVDANGSVQWMPELSDEEKLLFKTPFEIPQNVLLRLASQRQPKLCQTQSLNLFFGMEDSEEYLVEVHKEAFFDENCHSLYYLRMQAGVTGSSGECIACQ